MEFSEDDEKLERVIGNNNVDAKIAGITQQYLLLTVI